MSELNKKNIFSNISVYKKFRNAVKRAEEEIDKFIEVCKKGDEYLDAFFKWS